MGRQGRFHSLITVLGLNVPLKAGILLESNGTEVTIESRPTALDHMLLPTLILGRSVFTTSQTGCNLGVTFIFAIIARIYKHQAL